MTKKELLKRIEELERRIAILEAKVHVISTPAPEKPVTPWRTDGTFVRPNEATVTC